MTNVLREFEKKQNLLKEELSKQQTSQIRSNIERIISSYRHVWDIYTELLQNSADAIIEKFGEDNIVQGFIELEIEPEQRKIIITDNGLGIEESEISKILVNGKSLKKERNTGKFGFMGYGFTFVAFQSSLLKIESIKGGVKAYRTYQDLYKFVYSQLEIPNSQEEEIGKNAESVTEENGTKITVQFLLEFPNEVVEEALAATFRIAKSEDTIKSVLRTRSIVGTLATVFGSKNYFDFILKINGKIVPIPVGYLTVREIVKKVLNSKNEQGFYERVNEYETLVKIGDKLSIVQKDSALKVILLDEKIEDIIIGSRKQLQARVYISATSKSHINTYNEQCINTREKDGNVASDFKIEHGCWLAICGMPVGICLNSFEHSNYLPYTVIVDIKDNSIRQELDAGRKGISQYRMDQIANKVLDLLKERNFIKYRRYIVGGSDSRISNPLYSPQKELSNRFSEKQWFAATSLTQKYFPPLEEQEVISLFVELVAKNLLIGYNLKVLSGYQVYDGLYDYYLEQSEAVEYSNDNPLGIHKSIFNANGGSLRKAIMIELKKIYVTYTKI